MTNITIPKKVVEQALDALRDTETPAYRPQYEIEARAIYKLILALDQCEAEEPAKRSDTLTHEDIVRMAKEAEIGDSHGYIIKHEVQHLERFAALIAEQQDESAYQRGYLDGVVKGQEELIVEYPLERDLYDNKDWRCGSYAERVEWLHTMYESAKEQIAELEKLKACHEPVAWVNQSVLEWHLRQSEKVVKLTRKAQPGYGFVIPIYTNPQPPRQPLTRKKIQELVIEVCDTLYPQDESSYSEADSVFYTTFVRAVERAHHINHEGEEA